LLSVPHVEELLEERGLDENHTTGLAMGAALLP
jgi:hypothetical protein